MVGKSLKKIVNVFKILEGQIGKFYQQPDDADDILEAL